MGLQVKLEALGDSSGPWGSFMSLRSVSGSSGSWLVWGVLSRVVSARFGVWFSAFQPKLLHIARGGFLRERVDKQKMLEVYVQSRRMIISSVCLWPEASHKSRSQMDLRGGILTPPHGGEVVKSHY